MKKPIILLLVSLILLAGCSAPTVETLPAPTEQTSESQAPAPETDSAGDQVIEAPQPSTDPEEEIEPAGPADQPAADYQPATLVTAEVMPNESEARINHLTGLLEAYISDQGYDFDYDDERDCYYADFTIDNDFEVVDVAFYVYEDMIAARVSPIDWYVPEDSLDRVAQLTTRLNSDSSYAYFLLDYKNGYISSRCALIIEEAAPTLKEIDTIFNMTMDDFEFFGNAIRAVALDGADPKLVYDEVMELYYSTEH